MSLRYAILGLLAREPLTGYDLTKKFDSTIGFFWSAKHSQIYPELAALTTEGLVTFELVAQTSKPNKKVYTLTSEGHEALASWVAADGSERRAVKDPLLMRIWALGAVDPALALPHMRTLLAEQEARGAYYREAAEQVSEAPSEWLGAMLALRCGQMQNQAYVEWLRWAIDQLEQAKT